MHFIRVFRDEESVEHATATVFQAAANKSEASDAQRPADGTPLIPDVRENDIVEVGLTMYGSTPVLGGRYAAWAGFDSFNPWFESRHRLIRPVSRNIFVKEYNNPPDPDVTIRDDVEDSRWQIVGQKRREAEELTPPWLVLVPALQFGEFENWNEVACLFALF